MNAMIPSNITDHSIFFFAKGRPWDVSSDNPNFAELRHLLLTGSPDIDHLVELADDRIALQNQGLEFLNDEMVYNGYVLHNAWVDKILRFRDEGVAFEPVFNALKNLLTNPTTEAIQRLPLFVDRSKLGFLPDGRIACFKYVKEDYKDAHTGTVDWSVGSTPTMDRAEVDADPNRTCSRGLHVGALDYIKNYGLSGQNKIVLCAVWPSDFVAVPTDYQGGKARVCRAEVIDEVAKEVVDTFLASNQTVVSGYSTSPYDEVESEEPEDDLPEGNPPHEQAGIGDYIHVGTGTAFVSPGVYEVVEIGSNPACRLAVRLDPNYDPTWVQNEAVLKIGTIADAVKVGDWVETTTEGLVRITGPIEGDDTFPALNTDGDHVVVDSVYIEEIVLNPPAYRIAQIGQKVRVEGDPVLRDGIYEISDADDLDPDSRLTVETKAGSIFVTNDAVKEVITAS